MEKINVFQGMFSSWIFLAVLVSTVCFQAILVEFLGTFAQTVPLSPGLWLASVLIGAVGLPLAAIVKCIPISKADFAHHDDYVPIPSGPDMA